MNKDNLLRSEPYFPSALLRPITPPCLSGNVIRLSSHPAVVVECLGQRRVAGHRLQLARPLGVKVAVPHMHVVRAVEVWSLTERKSDSIGNVGALNRSRQMRGQLLG